ncbi:MAG: hypothetical protein BWY65_01429 [Firmicutes bacterium ADurb.Bin373]|nr:MAG: hypothetical protein BWY65_01429 [Firmicutes bacterium ADurb.Bin373]
MELKLDAHNFHSLKALLWVNESGKWEGVLGNKLASGESHVDVIRSQRVIIALPTEVNSPRGKKMRKT